MKSQIVAGLGLAFAVASVASCADAGQPTGVAEAQAGQSRAAAVPMIAAVAPQVAATLFELRGGGLSITYGPSADAETFAAPLLVFVYQDAQQTLTFRGGEISTTPTPAGLLVSVPIRTTIDSGSTTLSVLLPRVNVRPNMTTPIQTQAISAVHSFSVVPAGNLGQLDEYDFTPLQGTASSSPLVGAGVATTAVGVP